MDTAQPLSSVFPLLMLLMMAGAAASDEGCDDPIDIVFVLDSSGSVGFSNFNSTLELVRDLVDTFNISSGGVRVGVQKFSSSSNSEFYLNKFYDKEAMKTAIMNISYTGGGTNTSGALWFSRTVMFSRANGARCRFPNIIVLMTDGISNSQTETVSEAKLCRDEGIEIIALGIGSGINEGELRAVASDPDSEHVFIVSGFQNLTTVQTSIRKKACGIPLDPNPPVHNCTGLGYIPETGGPTCLCTVDDLGDPAGRLLWMAGNTTLARGDRDIKQLLLPPDVLNRNLDRQQIRCQFSTKRIKSEILSLNIAYGPDKVELDISHHYDANFNLSFIITCHVTGMNPLTPDMVQWGGLCKGQQGFTCTLDPGQTDVKGKNVSCRVTNAANNGLTAQADKMVDIVKPSPPSHNCTDLSYFPETGEVTCVCSADDLGFPPGRLVWMMGNTTLATAADHVHQLSLPAQYVKRGYDRQQLLCGLDWVKPEHVLLPLNVAYGPDNVTLDVYRHDVSNASLTVFYCHVVGLAPVTPDMVQWEGPCQGQQGFMCTLNPKETKVKGVNVTCRVTNTANNGHSAQAVTLIDKQEEPADNDQAILAGVVGGSLAALAVLLTISVTSILACRHRCKPRHPEP